MSQTKTVATVGTGAAFGNGIAYFIMWYVGYKYNLSFNDPELAIAMGGAVVAGLLMYVTKFFSTLGNGIKFLFNRMFPEKKP